MIRHVPMTKQRHRGFTLIELMVVLEVPPLPVAATGTLPPPAMMQPPTGGPMPPVAAPPTPVAPVAPAAVPVMPGGAVARPPHSRGMGLTPRDQDPNQNPNQPSATQ